MKRGYFKYNGKTYTTGTRIKIKPLKGKYQISYDEAVFMECMPKIEDKPGKEDWYKIAFTANDGIILTETEFYNRLIEVLNVENALEPEEAKRFVNPNFRKPTLSEEFSIKGLDIAWIWYVFLMLIATIFNGNVIIWIFLSVVFFRYRKRKLREAGYDV